MSQYDGPSPFLCNVTSGQVEVESAPFAPTIARYYLAINLIEHDITQKLDLEAILVAIVTSY